MFGVIEKIDRAILLFTQYKIRSKSLNRVMKFITFLGDYGLIWLSMSAGLILTKKYRRVGKLAMISLTICYLINNIVVKNIVHRKRPFNQYTDIKHLVKKPKDYSFPSGHTSGSFAAAGIFCRYLPGMIGKVSVILSMLIGYSRIYVGVHYPSDVIIGALIGITGSQLIYYVAKKIDIKK